MTWDHLSEWWVDEVAADPAYVEEVQPLVLDLLAPSPGRRFLDLGCGEGSVLRAVADRGADVIGLDGSERLARAAGTAFVALLPELAPVADASVDGAYMVLVLEHLDDAARVFEEVRRVVRPGGAFVLVVNHPIFTAPEATPITDPTDGETFFRPGRYFSAGYTDYVAGSTTVRFHHRTLSALLNAAADAGWVLSRLEERGVGPGQVERDPTLASQEHIPRLLAVRWERR